MAAGMQNGIAAHPIHVRSEISVQFCEPQLSGVQQLSGVHRITHFDRNEVVMINIIEHTPYCLIITSFTTNYV